MLRHTVILITGASGEIGHGLITGLNQRESQPIITLDLNPLDTGAGAVGPPPVHRLHPR